MTIPTAAQLKEIRERHKNDSGESFDSLKQQRGDLLDLVDEMQNTSREVVEKARHLGKREDALGIRWESFWNSVRHLDALLARLKGESP